MAEKVIKGEDIVEKDVFKDVRESAEKTLPLLKQMADTFDKFLLLTKENTKSNGGKSPTAKAFDEEAEAAHRAKAAMEATVNVKKEIIKTEEQLKVAYEKETLELANLRLQRQETNKEIKQTAILNQAEEGSLEQLRVKLSQATKALDQMSEARRKSVEGMKQLSAIETFRLKIDEIEQASGRFQRNVGNYKSGYDGLARSINQLTREAPAAAISMNTFFLAISNNIPMLVDEINQIKKANVELAASGQPTVSVLGKIAGAFFSWQTLISTGITLLTMYGGKLIDYIRGVDKAAESTYDFNEALTKTNDSISAISRKAGEAADRMNVAFGRLSKEEADYNKRFNENQEELKNIRIKYGKIKSDLDKNSGNLPSELQDALDMQQVFGKSMTKEMEAYYNRVLEIENNKKKELALQSQTYAQNEAAIVKEEQDKKEKAEKKTLEKRLKDNDDEWKAYIESVKRQYEANRKLEENEAKDKEGQRKYELELEREYQRRRAKIEKEFEDERKAQEKVDAISQKRFEDGLKDAALQKKKEREAAEKNIYDSLDKYQKEYYTNEEKRIDRSIANSQRREDSLRELAQSGIDNAQQSIAAEQKIQAEAEAKREKLLKQQQRTELFLTGFKTLTANLEANPGNAGKAFLETTAEISGLVAFLSTIPAFFEGTENTGEGGNGIDGKGGFHAILHPKERVMTAEQNKMIGDISNNEAAKVLAMYNSGAMLPLSVIAPTYESTQSNKVVNKLDELKEAINNIEIPIQDVYFDDYNKALIHSVETKNRIQNNHYKPKSGIWG